jgi:hypothetical protein
MVNADDRALWLARRTQNRAGYRLKKRSDLELGYIRRRSLTGAVRERLKLPHFSHIATLMAVARSGLQPRPYRLPHFALELSADDDPAPVAANPH